MSTEACAAPTRSRKLPVAIEIIRDLPGVGVTIRRVEEKARVALQTGDRAYVPEAGCLKIAGPAADLPTAERVRKASFG
jgi:branched-chain amino acid transport system ATP-binding protein